LKLSAISRGGSQAVKPLQGLASLALGQLRHQYKFHKINDLLLL
jgi:hypothetical protein